MGVEYKGRDVSKMGRMVRIVKRTRKSRRKLTKVISSLFWLRQWLPE
jgi:hypothetical protein